MICPECKKEISNTAKFCRFCGSKIEKNEILHQKPGMKNCPFCGKSVKQTAKFCRFCGGKVELCEEESPQKAAENSIFAKKINVPGKTAVIEEINVPEEPAFTEEIKVLEKPGVVEEINIPEGPAFTEEIKGLEKPGAVEEIDVPEEPVFTEEIKGLEKPAFTEERNASEESVFIEENKGIFVSDISVAVEDGKEENGSSKEQPDPVGVRNILFTDESGREQKKSVDIDETIFEEDREFLYDGICAESSGVPLWGMPVVNADKLAALEEAYKKNLEKDFEPYYRSLKPIAFSEKDTTPESIFNSSLGSYALKREPEQAEEAIATVYRTDDENKSKGTVINENGRAFNKIIDDSRKEVLSQRINGDNSGYIILALLSALLLFTAVVVGFTRLVLPKFSDDTRSDKDICLTEIVDADLYEDQILSDLILFEEI